ncbi:leucine-rich repeat domain-containing protein [Thalassotalea ganghwensis]
MSVRSSFNLNSKVQLFLFALAVISTLLLGHRLLLLTYLDKTPATIVSCDSKWVEISDTRSSANSRRKEQVQYYPIAETNNGVKVAGKVMLPTRKLCGQMVGTEVSVLIDANDETNHRIYSFIQFWALPLLAIAFCLLTIFGFIARKQVKWIALLFAMSYIATVTEELGYWKISELSGSHPQSRSNDTAQANTKQQLKSKNSLDRCIWAAMRKQKIEHRSELIKLGCQDQEISDLSSLADLTSLEELYLQNNQLTSLETLPFMPQLKVISVAGIKELITTQGIENAPNLIELQANKASLSSLSGVETLMHLKIFAAMQNQIIDLSSLTELTQLTEVILSYNKISDVTALANKPQLKQLSLHNNPITDISPLFDNTNLLSFGFSSTVFKQCHQISTLKVLLSENAKLYAPKQCQ